jgi:hypothetical protein
MGANSNWREGLRPERELILCCAHTRLDDATAGRIREILRGPLSWSDVMATAFDHHVDPFLYENLKLAGDGLVPAAWLDNMRDTARKSGGMAVLFFSELLRIYEIFEAEGVPLIPFKGPVLGWLAFRSLTRRRFLDLDFFVPQKHMPRAAALLKSAGFDGKYEQVDELAGRTGYVPGQYGFFREATRTQVELHTERTLRYFPVPLDFEKMSRRLITVEMCGRKLRTFSIEDTLVMLCVHGAKHFWDRLGWLLDVAELIAAQPVDWPLTMRIAAKLKCTRLLLLGLYLAHDLLNAPVPETILEQARRDSNVQWLAAKVRGELAGGASPHMGILPRAAFRFRSRDGVADAVGHMLRLATMPTENDRRNVRLPKALVPLYALVRPWKLIRQYGIGLRPGPRPDLAGFLPLRPEIVDHMLKFAAVKPGDVLYDLGCGDGRIVVAAAEKFGIHAVGVDIDPRRIAEAKANARKHGVQDHVRFLLGDARKIDMSEATLVTMYLETRGTLRLSDVLKQQLRPGARIVSCDSVIYGWPWDEREDHESAQGEVTSLYLWRIGNARPKDSGAETSL